MRLGCEVSADIATNLPAIICSVIGLWRCLGRSVVKLMCMEERMSSHRLPISLVLGVVLLFPSDTCMDLLVSLGFVVSISTFGVGPIRCHTLSVFLSRATSDALTCRHAGSTLMLVERVLS